MSVSDRLFATPRPRIEDFDFGRETAEVFDDMLERSVPLYEEQQRMVGELAADFVADGGTLYDLGCSTCTSFLHVARCLPPEVRLRFVGVDSSGEMLDIARQKLTEAAFPHLTSRLHLRRACAVLVLLLGRLGPAGARGG